MSSKYILVSDKKVISGHFYRSTARENAEKESRKRKGAELKIYRFLEEWE